MGSGIDTTLDVTVDVDPAGSVSSLVDALVDYCGHQGIQTAPRSEARLFRLTPPQLLDPLARVVDTALVDGDTVVLAGVDVTEPSGPGTMPTALPVRRGGARLTLDVTAGPEAGRMVPLGPGTFVVGRAPSCTVAVDDPVLSREHFMVHVIADDQVVVVPNPAATNGTYIGGQKIVDARSLEPGEYVQAGASSFAVRLADAPSERRRDPLGLVPFNRVPYRQPLVTERSLGELEAPPKMPDGRELPITAALAPLLSGVGMAVMIGRYYFLAIAALSPILLFYRHVTSRRRGKRRYRADRAKFRDGVEGRIAAVEAALEAERSERLRAAPDLAELGRRAMLRTPHLWERNRQADDFLHLRLGLGDLPSRVTTGLQRGGDEELRAEAIERLARHTEIAQVPVTVDLVAIGVLGLCGGTGPVAAVSGALMTQAACLHSPEDLVIAAGLHQADLDGFEWLKWLPHVRSSASPLDGEHLAVGSEATRELLLNLLQLAADRGGQPSDQKHLWPRLLVLFREAAEPDPVLLSQLLDIGPSVGIAVIWMGQSELQMPRQCGAVVRCRPSAQPATLRYTDPRLPERMVDLDGIRSLTALEIARSLAPLRDASAGNETTAIPRIVPLLDITGLDRPLVDGVVQRWKTPRAYGLAFPIGVSAKGVLRLDLVEHGPHTLIGGTSGAGKSELLQTLVLSLAVDHPPDRLNFLFVDYKGGASSAAFRRLPHTVGYVTNLDGAMSMRALTSLRAELQRRMTVMEGRAKDLAEMLQVAPDETPTSLVIIVDEFATLVKEIPDFVAGMVDVAQRGRSLGIHLVLATQRPTGVVNENIQGNSNLRICLRVLDPTDSKNIVGTRDAVDIPVPLRGRGYVRTGPQALMAFQCAWSGAPVAAGDEVGVAHVQRFTFGGQRAAGPPSPPTAREPLSADGAVAAPTHLDVLVDACAEAHQALALDPPRRPWIEPLPEVLNLQAALDGVRARELVADPGRVVVLGRSDDPENQAQPVATVDLEASGGLLVFGTGGSGKSTLLRTVAVAAAIQGRPDEVEIYVVDFASRALDAVRDLPHCREVIAGDDPERVARLITVLTGEIERRRDLLAGARAESLSAFRANGRRPGSPGPPRTLVLLDGYNGLHSTFDRGDGYEWLTQFQHIVSAGRQVGIHCVIATDRRSGLPAALMSAISSRLVLRMAAADELSALGVPRSLTSGSELSNGRGFLDGSTLVQVACVSPDPSGAEQSEGLTTIGANLEKAGHQRLGGLPELPETFILSRPADRALVAPIGLVDLSVDIAEVDLARQHFVVTGPPLSGKSSTLEALAWGLRAVNRDGPQLVVLGGPASPLSGLDLWDEAAFTRGSQADVVARLAEKLDGVERVEAELVLFVDSAEDIDGAEILRPLEALTKHDAVRLVVACDPTTMTRTYSGWMSVLRRNRSTLFLQPESRADVHATLGIKPTLRPGQAFPPGRGVLVANRRWLLVQAGLRPPTPTHPAETAADGTTGPG